MSAEMRAELLRLMPVQHDSDWGPNPIVCRWCGCWLKYSDNSSGKPVEDHTKDCFAARVLKRPARKAQF